MNEKFLKNCHVFFNERPIVMIERSLARGESIMGSHGQLCVGTGRHTGRAAQDKYMIDNVLIDVTYGPAGRKMDSKLFEKLSDLVSGYLQGKEIHVVDFHAADKKCRLISETAWHSVFATRMFKQSDEPHDNVDLTIVDVPGCHSDPDVHFTRSDTFVACDFTNGLVLIGGTNYAGEIKKSVFSYLSYIYPQTKKLPMHSSVTLENDDGSEQNSTVFFGLSGTGKTTLSADPKRQLVGDDEHVWTDEGIMNLEGGCYAKVINLSSQKEPLIWEACHQFGTVLENVVMNENRELDFDNKSITENTRAAYPLTFIKNSLPLGTVVSHPKNIIMLTCDAFGVLPCVAKLSPQAAAYHFISGYTAKVSGTEAGVTEPTATFSACFGAPFMAKHTWIYASLLEEKIIKHCPNVWLVNTGWQGGGPGVGKRIDINTTRRIIDDIITGRMLEVDLNLNETFNLVVPSHMGNPRDSWLDKENYDKTATRLIEMFNENSAKHIMTLDVLNAGMPTK